MSIITFHCTSISPLFIGNAIKNEAELRAPAIKASLRFWWRAIHPNLTIEELKKKECEFFGGTFYKGNKQINYPPSFKFLSIKYDSSRIKAEYVDERGRTVNGKLIYKNEYNYLTNPENNDKPFGKYLRMSNSIIGKNEFPIQIQILKNKEWVIAIFQLASILGGLGLRARRGNGAWKIEKIINGHQEIILNYNKNCLFTPIKILNDSIISKENNNKITITNSEKIYNQIPFLKTVELGEGYDSLEELRRRIMHTAHLLNNRNNGQYLGFANRDNRLASPIYVSIIKEDEMLRPIISTLWCKETPLEGINLQNKFKTAILNNIDPR
ncbi:type III-B CRISPR module RAMP protein Cmr1 [Lutibacter maritimus]|uniref:CRISPR-associated protein Cmr1 n=1 Tax=Lutibacter maritimus TaxID=593133 RepID=A0A1I6SQT1_9FLAO|nr:type III-B CRISPR module RAMP protein Cmr1 [Lutibacter maritimus]SFS79311.1 CRISPR-associated protein Cmr1 [Lutibacter maritimus]